jgi:hypothetical protein
VTNCERNKLPKLRKLHVALTSSLIQRKTHDVYSLVSYLDFYHPLAQLPEIKFEIYHNAHGLLYGSEKPLIPNMSLVIATRINANIFI